MKRSLSRLVLAVTSLVVVAFTVPLAALVQRDADASARTAAETVAQGVASNVVRQAVTEGVDSLATNVPPLPTGTGLVFPSGLTAGDVTGDAMALAAEATTQQRAVSAYTANGWGLALPVLTRDGVVVVTAAVPYEELRAGVTRAWVLLGALGLVLIGVSLVLASRLGRSLTDSVAELGTAARALAAGDLTTRVDVDDPPELAAVADAFNDMAPRLQALIEQEREEVADISHRLRTPLARLRLQSERVADEQLRLALADNLDRVDRAVDEIIAEVRSRSDHVAPGITDLGAFITERGAFWSVLAEEQGRSFDVTVSVPRGTAVPVSARDLTIVLDTLVGNVFDHTDDGVAFELRCDHADGEVVITVDDAGLGFPPGIDPLARGVSGGGSTGLGLDIARRTTERVGGTLRTGSSRLGGASVQLVLPVSSRT